MATRIYAVTATPVDLLVASDIDGDPLSLAAGATYSGRYQSVGAQSTMKVVEAATGTTLTAASPALRVRSYEDVVIKPVSGQGVFVWAEDDGLLIINDVQ